jgi:hypothetical protein
MSTPTTIPTLLVFTLGPECEGGRRRLLPAPLRQTEATLHRAGLEQMLAIGRDAGYRVVVAAPEPLDLPPEVRQLRQRGTSFGGRLQHALRALRAEIGSAPLLVVGTDTPDLAASHLRAAVAELESSPTGVVVGPAHDGGFYLLASRIGLDSVLSTVRWCCRDTRRSLLAALCGQGHPVHLLEPLLDLDRRADLERWLSRRRAESPLGRLRRTLRAVLAVWRRPAVPTVLRRADLVLATAVSGRGPPH